MTKLNFMINIILDWKNSNLFIYIRSQIIFSNKIFLWNIPCSFEKRIKNREEYAKQRPQTNRKSSYHLYETAFQRLMHSDQHPSANGPIYQRIAWPIRRTIIVDVPGVPRGNTSHGESPNSSTRNRSFAVLHDR